MTVKQLIRLLRKKDPKALVMMDLQLPASDRKWQIELSDVQQERYKQGADKFRVVWLS